MCISVYVKSFPYYKKYSSSKTLKVSLCEYSVSTTVKNIAYKICLDCKMMVFCKEKDIILLSIWIFEQIFDYYYK